MVAGKSEGRSFGRRVSRISCGSCRGSRIEPAADVSRAIDIENTPLDRLSFLASTARNKRRLGRRKGWKKKKRSCVMREGSAVYEKNREEDEKTCRCLGETRLKSSWTRIG